MTSWQLTNVPMVRALSSISRDKEKFVACCHLNPFDLLCCWKIKK